MPAPPPHPGIAHLSAEEADSLVERYYAGDDLGDLIRHYRLGCAPSHLYRLLPPLVLDRVCPWCGSVMVQLRQSRSASAYLREAAPSCVRCGHRAGVRCECAGCHALRAAEAQRIAAARQAAIEQRCASAVEERAVVREVRELTLGQAVGLLVLWRSYARSAAGDLCPPTRLAVPLAPPVAGHTLFHVLDLLERGPLVPSPASAHRAFVFSGERLEEIHFEQLCWRVLAEDAARLVADVEQCALAGPRRWPESWADEAEHCLGTLMRMEAKAYLAYCAAQRRWALDLDDPRVDEMLVNLLRDHSVAQCCRIIWAAAQRTADAIARAPYLRGGITALLVGHCQRWADRARAEGWEVKPFRRNFDLPRSMLSHVLGDVFLRIGEQAFERALKDIEYFAHVGPQGTA